MPHPARVVAVVTAALAVAAAVYVLRFGTNVPVVDEWDLVPDARAAAADGSWPGWPVRRHNEHFFPPGRAAFLAAFAAGGWDLRAPMLASVAALAGAAGLFAAAAAAGRGRAAAGDVVLPAALLHWGHSYNLLMGYQVVFALLPAAAGGFARQVMADDGGRRAGAWLGLWAGLIVLSGGMGVAFAPGLAAWLGYRGWAARRTGGLGVGAATSALVGGYAVWAVAGLPPAPDPAPADLPLWQRLVAGGQFLATGAGTWVVDGPWEPVTAAAVFGHLAAAGVLAHAVVRRPAERVRAAGLLALLAGVAGMAVGVGWVRGGGLADRYVTLAAVGPCVGWVAAARYAPRLPAAVGVLAAGLLVGLNAAPGWRYGAALKGHNREVERAARAGLPPAFLGARFAGAFRGPADWLAVRMDGARRERHGALAVVPPDRPLAELPLPDPAALAVPPCDVPRFLAGPPVVAVPPPGRRVVGLRVRYELDRAPSFLELALGWAGGGEARVTLNPRAGPGETRFWVDAEPTVVTLRPLCPTFGVRVTAADWLVEPPGS